MPAPIKTPKRFFKQNTTSAEVDQPQKVEPVLDLAEKKIVEKQWYKRTKVWAVIMSVIAVISTLIAIPLVMGYWYLSSFAQAADSDISTIYQEIRSGSEGVPTSVDNHITYLILGLDQIDGQRDSSLLTDTMIVATYNVETNSVTTVPIPRDLWLDAYKTKINAIYYYGEESEEITGEEFTVDVVEEITGLTIQHVIVFRLDYLEELITMIGGVEIDVTQGFVDNEFPRSDVDTSTVTDPELLYETVVFEEGPQIMDGMTALKYIRSRHSQDLVAGTDNARSQRQIQLIQAIIKKVQDKSLLQNPRLLGSLYKWFQNHFVSEEYPIGEYIKVARVTQGNIPELESATIPIADDENPGLLVHPPTEKYQQWVYEPLDPTWGDMRAFFGEI